MQGFAYAYLQILVVLVVVAALAALLGFLIGRRRSTPVEASSHAEGQLRPPAERAHEAPATTHAAREEIQEQPRRTAESGPVAPARGGAQVASPDPLEDTTTRQARVAVPAESSEVRGGDLSSAAEEPHQRMETAGAMAYEPEETSRAAPSVADLDETPTKSDEEELLREKLRHTEQEMARLEARAIQAWDETIATLETKLNQLQEENQSLVQRLNESDNLRLIEQEKAHRLRDALRSAGGAQHE
uniref:hypothetical protein n=1 Tax=Tessaracoccus timonensis TaxID=2161816 RepID=UPI000D551DED|nr:hypothetical protein [Tessaracoccus timonensis]